ncbi:MAG: hypothetical protein OEZ39_16875 [Gammaproteobacteria bacterium]|nr:hypothetical protein [Gammaproteobacteria bacterium]MDH5653535.1 hypothetical protein [Gammaproteobacteria bacterium]
MALPSDWVAEADPDCETLFHPEGNGVLQFSTLVQAEDISQDDLRAFAIEHIEAGAKPETQQVGGFSGLYLSYDDAEYYWREWYLRAGKLFLFVTYHCQLEDEGNEDDIVDQILDSLETTIQ